MAKDAGPILQQAYTGRQKQERINYSWEYFKLDDKQRMQVYGVRYGLTPEQRTHRKDIQ